MVKFNPVGAATWLATELDEEGDPLFGLADLEFGFPELGSFSLSELMSLPLPLGMSVGRDILFKVSAVGLCEGRAHRRSYRRRRSIALH